MAPLGKDAMTHGLTGIDRVTFRVTGGVLLLLAGGDGAVRQLVLF